MRRKLTIGIAAAALLVQGVGRTAPTNPGSSESVCARSDVILCEDLEDGDHVGWDWGGSSWDSCIWTRDVGGYNSPNAYKERLFENAAECGAPSKMIPPQTGPIYQRWYIKFGPGYQFLNWTDQKINYFSAMVNDVRKWRMMLGARSKSDSERGIGQFVVDATGHDPRWYFNGDSTAPGNAATKYVTPNNWYCVEFAIKPNTPGQSDGWVKVWLDDKEYINSVNQNIKSTGEPINQAPWLSTYYGGEPPGTHPTMDIWYDNIVVAKSRIGCGTTPGGGDDTTPPDVTNVHRVDTAP